MYSICLLCHFVIHCLHPYSHQNTNQLNWRYLNVKWDFAFFKTRLRLNVCIYYSIYLRLSIIPDFEFSYSFMFSFLSCNAYIPMFTPEAISLFEDGYCIGGNVPEFWWHPVLDVIVETEICNNYIDTNHSSVRIIRKKIYPPNIYLLERSTIYFLFCLHLVPRN